VTLATAITVAGNNWTESLAVDHSAHRNRGDLERHRASKVIEVIEVIGNQRLGGLALLKVGKGAGSTLEEAEGCLERIGEDNPEEEQILRDLWEDETQREIVIESLKTDCEVRPGRPPGL
jgi:hypothetical protein